MLRAIAWNAAFIIAGLLLIAVAGEIYLRMANPFIESHIPKRFVEGVGFTIEPNAEMRFANWADDNFVVSRSNSLGFLDREPVSAERAAASCHIAFIGDSYVMAREVPIADKFHVRLEEMAARELPRLAITTQAYGMSGTGQINQLPFYDEYARRLNPKLIILVFYGNDFRDNSIALQSVHFGMDPARTQYMTAQKDARGAIELRLPDPEFQRFMLPRLPNAWHENTWKRLVRISYLAAWLNTKMDLVRSEKNPSSHAAWLNMISERPCCGLLLDGYTPQIRRIFSTEHLPPVYQEALEYTEFGVEEFKRRTDRDGAKLAILSATAEMGTRGDLQFDRLNAIAEARGIPVISDYDYIVRQGYDAADGLWHFNQHWNATGHQWVAESVLEWLKENQDVCD